MNDGELSVWRKLMEVGTQCLGDEQYLKAEDYFTQGLLKAYQLTVPEIVAFTLRLLATVRVRLGNLEFAEEGFKEALRICQEIQNEKGMAEAWAGLASVSVKKGMFQDAGREYELSISVYPNSSPPLRLGMLYADLGQVYASLKEWSMAMNAYTQAQEICRANGFPKGEGEMAVLLGELCFQQGKKTEATLNLKHACQVFALLADPIALSNTLQYLALLYFDQNEMRLAFECQQRAVALCLQFDTKKEFSDSCFFLSKIEQILEDYVEAKYYLELSIQFHTVQDLDLALRYQNLAGLCFLAMDLAKAELYYIRALSLFESIEDHQRTGEVYEALTNLKEIRESKVVPPEAQAKLEDNIQLQREFSLEDFVRLAEFYEKRRNFRDALEYYWKALQIGRDTKKVTDWIETRVQRVSKSLRRKK
ncbi:Tetratricopeptide repeat family protein [Candidatus Desulfosporosinus infrequens]|uniref:Tetratricopeptide repeat family protein n=1 Tax=Candidatus Desulfosporosinus infrequens TaxID=2043169 RepID=A0A2U3K0D0_9FIRM|nr:Tetratricopeptide repeat family protein [Candidatus Desulfosporosinus infrequens]